MDDRLGLVGFCMVMTGAAGFVSVLTFAMFYVLLNALGPVAGALFGFVVLFGVGMFLVDVTGPLHL